MRTAASQDALNVIVARVAIALVVALLLLWCGSCVHARAAPMEMHRGNAGTDVRCSVTGGEHEWMRGGNPNDVRCWNCDRPK